MSEVAEPYPLHCWVDLCVDSCTAVGNCSRLEGETPSSLLQVENVAQGTAHYPLVFGHYSLNIQPEL